MGDDMCLHEDFKIASWRGTTNSDGEVIGLSFLLGSGEVIRLALDANSALMCADSIFDYLGQVRTNVHSDNSSGNPSVDVSLHLV